jgi:hypothetical protein
MMTEFMEDVRNLVEGYEDSLEKDSPDAALAKYIKYFLSQWEQAVDDLGKEDTP